MGTAPLLTLLFAVSQYSVGSDCAPVAAVTAPDVAYQGGVTPDGWALPQANLEGGVSPEKLGDVNLSLDLPVRDFAPNVRPELDLSEAAQLEIDDIAVSQDGSIRSSKGLFSTARDECQ